MTCKVCLSLIQRRLDGDDDPHLLDDHLRTCPDCAASVPAVRRLLNGLDDLAPPAVPPLFSARLKKDCLSQARAWARRRRIRRWNSSLAALAACLLVVSALWLWPRGDSNGPDSDPGRNIVQQPKDAPTRPTEPLRSSMDQATNAVVLLTKHTAEETLEATSSLLPLMQRSTIESLAPSPMPLPEAPVEPFVEATSSVSSGLAPVAESARRAFQLFRRDLPVARTNETSPN
jgi:hypothetical protein